MENNSINEPKSNNQRKENQGLLFFLITLAFFAIVLTLYIFLFLQRNKPTHISNRDQRPNTEFFVIDEKTSKITKTDKEPEGIIVTDFDFSGDEFRPIGSILRGYLDSLDPEKNILKFKNQILKQKDLQLLEVNTSKISFFYCWPETFPSDNGPIDIKTTQVASSSKTKNIYHPEEKPVPLDQIDVFIKKDHFVILQLEDEFEIEKTNFIKKLVVLGC